MWCPPGAGAAEGTLVCTSVSEGALWRVWPASGRREMIADTGGGANGAALAADGGFLVTQNGGLDFSIFEIFGDVAAAALRAVGPAARRARRHRQLPDPRARMQMPNDLCVAPDGTVYFTDPQWPAARPAERARPRARSRRRAARRRRRLLGARTASRSTSTTRRSSSWRTATTASTTGSCASALTARGSRSQPGRMGDGCALDVDGRIYMAGGGHVVTIYEPDGTVVEQLAVPG